MGTGGRRRLNRTGRGAPTGPPIGTAAAIAPIAAAGRPTTSRDQPTGAMTDGDRTIAGAQMTVAAGRGRAGFAVLAAAVLSVAEWAVSAAVGLAVAA
jgi:hypothetical protein